MERGRGALYVCCRCEEASSSSAVMRFQILNTEPDRTSPALRVACCAAAGFWVVRAPAVPSVVSCLSSGTLDGIAPRPPDAMTLSTNASAAPWGSAFSSAAGGRARARLRVAARGGMARHRLQKHSARARRDMSRASGGTRLVSDAVLQAAEAGGQLRRCGCMFGACEGWRRACGCEQPS
jgi:hypothetical protein